MAGEPLKFINSFPSFLAVTVAASFKTQVTPYWSENSLAAARGSSLISSTGFSVSRENSSTWGVRMIFSVKYPFRYGYLAARFTASASMTMGT